MMFMTILRYLETLEWWLRRTEAATSHGHSGARPAAPAQRDAFASHCQFSTLAPWMATAMETWGNLGKCQEAIRNSFFLRSCGIVWDTCTSKYFGRTNHGRSKEFAPQNLWCKGQFVFICLLFVPDMLPGAARSGLVASFCRSSCTSAWYPYIDR